MREGKTLFVWILNEDTSTERSTDESLQLTCATANLIQSKPMTALQDTVSVITNKYVFE